MAELLKQTRENNFILQRSSMLPLMVITFWSGMGHQSLIFLKKGVQKNATDSLSHIQTSETKVEFKEG